MAAQQRMDALREEMLLKIDEGSEDCKLNIESGNEEAKKFTKSKNKNDFSIKFNNNYIR